MRRSSPSAFRTKWIRAGLGWVAMKIFREVHASAKFIEVSFDFSPIYMTGVGQKERPLASNWVSSRVRLMLMTALVSK